MAHSRVYELWALVENLNGPSDECLRCRQWRDPVVNTSTFLAQAAASLSLFHLMKGVCSYTSKWDICFSSGLSCCQGRAIKDVNFVPKNSAVISSATASVSNQVTNVCLETFAVGYLQSELGAS